MRGNVDTRLRKLTEDNFDAIVLAEAGLKRRDQRQADFTVAVARQPLPYGLLEELPRKPAAEISAIGTT
jgi:porphobilinogen deaminase